MNEQAPHACALRLCSISVLDDRGIPYRTSMHDRENQITQKAQCHRTDKKEGSVNVVSRLIRSRDCACPARELD